MGTTHLKSKDFLHGGKPTSYSRKARRVMKRELIKNSNGQQITDLDVEFALDLLHKGESNGN